MSRTNKWQPEKERPKKFKPEKKKSSVKRMKYMDFEEEDEEQITLE